VTGRDQWHPLPTGGDVAAAKIFHYVDAGEFRQKGWVVDSQGVAILWAVTQGLSMTADSE